MKARRSAISTFRGLHQATRAFTLLDVVITLMIMGLISAIAVPKFANTLTRSHADAAARRVKADLTLARQTAIAESVDVVVTFSITNESYTIPELPHLDQPGMTYEVLLADPPYNADIVSTALGGDQEVKFDRFGKPDSGGTVTVQYKGMSKTITIDPDTGRASIS